MSIAPLPSPEAYVAVFAAVVNDSASTVTAVGTGQETVSDWLTGDVLTQLALVAYTRYEYVPLGTAVSTPALAPDTTTVLCFTPADQRSSRYPVAPAAAGHVAETVLAA